MGIFSPETISVGEVFAGAILPGLLLVSLYMLYLVLVAFFKPSKMPAMEQETADKVSLLALLNLLAGPMLLIVAVLGSILMGLATPTEAAAVGASGAMLLALKQNQLSIETLRAVVYQSARVSAMVFMILIGASLFSLVFRGYGGDEYVQSLLVNLPGGQAGALLIVMLVLFLLGFILDFIEITYVVIPIVGPVLLAMGIDPVWLGVMIAINLQTSFLTPPFGFSLFYLRGVAPPEIATSAIYRGVIPFIAIQLLMLGMLTLWPEMATWLPHEIYSG
jgi:tripartite ATP-independent transporter DctM subunit